MPELPEVERVRRTLEPHLLGAVLGPPTLARRDIVDGECSEAALLGGARVGVLRRRGKQLAVVAAGGPGVPGRALPGRVLVVHLGMTGQFFHVPAGQAERRSDHVHIRWPTWRDGVHTGELLFRDPRRFGGLWPLADEGALEARWSTLGPDGLSVGGEALAAALGGTRRALKAALLDQAVVAGVGNIYADEALHRARLHPTRRADRVRPEEAHRLADAIRTILGEALAAGGSTLRDYVDANGERGEYALRHAVYGRGGAPCTGCGTTLTQAVVGQRTTVFCRRCQPRRAARSAGGYAQGAQIGVAAPGHAGQSRVGRGGLG